MLAFGLTVGGVANDNLAIYGRHKAMMGVKRGVQPPSTYLLAAVANVSERLGVPLTVTSHIDGRHSEWSGHYQLRAIDIRTKGLTIPATALCEMLAQEAVSLMSVPATRIYCKRHKRGTSSEHIHLQFK